LKKFTPRTLWKLLALNLLQEFGENLKKGLRDLREQVLIEMVMGIQKQEQHRETQKVVKTGNLL
jgi:hypothetical protein